MKPHPFLARLDRGELARPYGHVRKIAAGLVEATGPAGALGELCEIECQPVAGDIRTVLAEVTRVDERGIVLAPLEHGEAICTEARVFARPERDRLPVGDAFAGRAVDALGRPIDGLGPVEADESAPAVGAVPRPLERVNPGRIAATGLRVMDGLLPLAEGQRIGIFAASGVGKTSLIEQLAAQVDCDRCLLCLVGERGREVEGLWRAFSARPDAQRYTIVAATSDESAAMRARSVDYALCLAEHWRARGEHVLLIVDSITRLAMALREIGLASGAPPTVRAYTPNVFAALPRLVERCGATASGGAITSIMTVLSETDDIDDPIVELMKSLLDGHVLLSRALAEQGQFPAVDVARSVSRGAERMVAPPQAEAMREAVAMLGAYEEARVMIETGVYKAGTNATVDRAIALRGAITEFLRQGRDEHIPLDETVRRLKAVVAGSAGRG
jgi:flagellum-specific ATP synthase